MGSYGDEKPTQFYGEYLKIRHENSTFKPTICWDTPYEFFVSMLDARYKCGLATGQERGNYLEQVE